MRSRLSPSHQRRITEQLRIAEDARRLVPGSRVPCFAHMRVRAGKGQKDFLLGAQTRTTPELSLLHWQDAPLSEVFFECAEGEDYELEVADRTLAGTLLERNLLGFQDGELVEIITPEAVLSRRGGGPWRLLPERWPRLRSPVGDRTKDVGAMIEVQLDAAQRRVVELPASRSVLVLGEAGCGKTTVALHRLAFLLRNSPSALRAAVIVPTDALRRLIEMLLERLSVEGVEVWLYDRWAAQQARKVFLDLPRRESQNATAATTRLKRDPALRVALAELARKPPSVPDEDAPRRACSKALARWEDLHHLFGDRGLLQKVVAASAQGVTAGAIPETAEHTRIQFSDTAEVEFAHVRRKHLQTTDGRLIDEGTPTEDATSLDVEDYAVLFELEKMRAELRNKRPATPPAYDVIVVDEAQELAPLELSLIGRSVAKRGTLIVAGDAEQQIDPTASFTGWEATMAELGAKDHEIAVLTVSYRCPPDVVTLARPLRDPGGALAGRVQPSPSLAFARFENDCHLAAWTVSAIRELQRRSARASVSIICRSREAARSLSRTLGRGIEARLALDGDFDFLGGVNVTCVEEVKGLEFDHVILPDASASSYPDTLAARRALYVAVTRASRQLVLASVGRFTPLVQRPAPSAESATLPA